MPDMFFRLTAGTDVGRIRTNNEDNFIVNDDLESKDWFVPDTLSEGGIELKPSGCVFAVADGMGGMNAGEVASAMAIDTVKELFSMEDFSKTIDSPKHIEAFLREVIEKADERIKARVKEEPETSGMGTTIVLVWVTEGIAHVVWCGDSRAYLFNSASGLIRLTKDHSYVQQLVDSGKLDKELAFDHPDSNIITRSLGDTNSKAQPDYVSRELSEGDRILLCSDGLCGLCRDEEIMQIMADNPDNIEECKGRLIDAALEAGGYDNVTVALFELVKKPEDKAPSLETTNDAKNAKKRKKRQRLLIAAVLILLAAAALAVLYKFGKLDIPTESIKTLLHELKESIK